MRPCNHALGEGEHVLCRSPYIKDIATAWNVVRFGAARDKVHVRARARMHSRVRATQAQPPSTFSTRRAHTRRVLSCPDTFQKSVCCIFVWYRSPRRCLTSHSFATSEVRSLHMLWRFGLENEIAVGFTFAQARWYRTTCWRPMSCKSYMICSNPLQAWRRPWLQRSEQCSVD